MNSEHREHTQDTATESFVAHRNLLFTVAYEMLGSAADAEDVLQETWLRWAGVELDTVRDHRAYLVRITTRQALTRLRTLGRRKESYVGTWLPAPLLTAPDVAEDVELADSVSMAMLLVLETLTPTERAVFVLREVFDLGYDEIAEAVDKSPAAVRQIAHRARAHVAARRPAGACPRPRPGTRSTPSSGRSGRGTCRGCSTSLRRTSSSWATAAASSRPSCSPWWGPTRWRACWPRGWAGSRPSRCGKPRSTAIRHWSSGSTTRSTPWWRCASTTASSPGSTPYATPRSCRTWGRRPR